MATKKLTNLLILLLIFSNSLIAKEWNFDAILNEYPKDDVSLSSSEAYRVRLK